MITVNMSNNWQFASYNSSNFSPTLRLLNENLIVMNLGKINRLCELIKISLQEFIQIIS